MPSGRQFAVSTKVHSRKHRMHSGGDDMERQGTRLSNFTRRFQIPAVLPEGIPRRLMKSAHKSAYVACQSHARSCPFMAANSQDMSAPQGRCARPRGSLYLCATGTSPSGDQSQTLDATDIKLVRRRHPAVRAAWCRGECASDWSCATGWRIRGLRRCRQWCVVDRDAAPRLRPPVDGSARTDAE